LQRRTAFWTRLPTDSGAERIAELILHEESLRFVKSPERSHGFQLASHHLFEPGVLGARGQGRSGTPGPYEILIFRASAPLCFQMAF
jgi:hypothetical protein